jgi:DNA-binding NtrC family response regulator
MRTIAYGSSLILRYNLTIAVIDNIFDKHIKMVEIDNIVRLNLTMSPGSFGRLQVLLVDDDPVLWSSVEGTLNAHYIVRCACSVNAAIREIVRQPPDVVLYDFEMFPKSGAELLKVVAKLRPTVVRILYSGAHPSLLNGLLDKGLAHGFIRKGCSSDYLVTAIDRAAAKGESR